MKNTIITLAIAVGSLVGFSTQAEAGTKGDILRFVGHQLAQSQHGYRGYQSPNRFASQRYVQPRHVQQGHCSQPYLIRTAEVCRRCETRVGRRPCGSIFHYNVTVVTYRDYFSNGTSRTYARTLS